MLADGVFQCDGEAPRLIVEPLCTLAQRLQDLDDAQSVRLPGGLAQPLGIGADASHGATCQDANPLDSLDSSHPCIRGDNRLLRCVRGSGLLASIGLRLHMFTVTHTPGCAIIRTDAGHAGLVEACHNRRLMSGTQDTGVPRWVQPSEEQVGLRHYIEVLSERKWTIFLALLLAVAAAVVYLATASKVYEAEAEMLVTPASNDDPALASLPLIRESSDPTRDVETASRLITTIDVAERVRDDLAVETNATDLLGDVTAVPVAESNIIAVAAEGDSPKEAQELANAFADAAVEERTTQLHDAIDVILPDLRARLTTTQAPTEELTAQVTRLETLASAADPTLRVETQAALQSTPISPRPQLTIVAAVLAGLLLGIGAAFALQTIDPRLRREEQLRSRYRLPILGRIPKEPGRRRAQPLGPQELSMPTLEAYRTLRATLDAANARTGDSTVLLITGSSPSEGKTTTAVNIACSLALSGNRVILIDADLRRPAVGQALGATAKRGVVSVMLENASLEEALVTTAATGPDLQILLADHEGSGMSELFSLPAAERLIQDSKALADYVIIDSPPLTTVIDALPLARRADGVLIVTRLGTTRLDRLHELAELLVANDLRPVGLAVLGMARTDAGGYYYLSGAERGLGATQGSRVARTGS